MFLYGDIHTYMHGELFCEVPSRVGRADSVTIIIDDRSPFNVVPFVYAEDLTLPVPTQLMPDHMVPYTTECMEETVVKMPQVLNSERGEEERFLAVQ